MGGQRYCAGTSQPVTPYWDARIAWLSARTAAGSAKSSERLPKRLVVRNGASAGWAATSLAKSYCPGWRLRGCRPLAVPLAAASGPPVAGRTGFAWVPSPRALARAWPGLPARACGAVALRAGFTGAGAPAGLGAAGGLEGGMADGVSLR